MTLSNADGGQRNRNVKNTKATFSFNCVGGKRGGGGGGMGGGYEASAAGLPHPFSILKLLSV